jgi:peptide/nickel transport system substrate-binding protein
MMGKRRQTLGMVGLALVVALVAAACGGGGNNATPGGGSGTAQKGGVYRTATEDFDFTGGFDPTGEYLGTAFEDYQALLRTLVSYKHIAGPAGNVIYPDLAASMPTISSDGLTYTFKLKPNIKFGQPVNRVITSHDIEYAFERINNSKLVAQYGFYYYGTVKGMDGKATSSKPVSGIETPDDSTIIFHLDKPTGDFLFRLSMAAAAPVPKEVAKCFDSKAGEYGRFVISSGPYQIAGSDKLNVSSCNTMKPISGFDPTSKLNMVRNPNYDQKTDNLRSNYLDGISQIKDTNTSDIFNRVQAGTLDGTLDSKLPSTTLRQYVTNPTLKPRLHTNTGDRTWYIYMNLLTPPFDDIHVRKAVNLIIDKAAMQQAWGGPSSVTIATHIMPPVVLNGQLTASYDPYATPGEHGDLAKAQAEMKQSRYDTKHDGTCGASVCKNLVMINRNTTPWTNTEPIVVSNLAKLGIQVKPRENESAYTIIQVVKNNIPIALNAGWGKDFADAGTFATPLFGSAAIIANGNTNYSMIGVTASQAASLGVKLPPGGAPPSVDADIAACEPLPSTTPEQLTARNNCWANFDKKVMEQVVPWVPYNWQNVLTTTAGTVTHWEFDQFASIPSFTQIAVNNKINASTLS